MYFDSVPISHNIRGPLRSNIRTLIGQFHKVRKPAATLFAKRGFHADAFFTVHFDPLRERLSRVFIL